LSPFTSQQFNLNDGGSQFQANYASWPDRGYPDYRQWLHNDMKDVAYFFTYPLFDEIVTDGGLK
jgi:hypothetical protein